MLTLEMQANEKFQIKHLEECPELDVCDVY